MMNQEKKMKFNFHMVEIAMLSALAAGPVMASESAPPVPVDAAPPTEQVKELKEKVQADKAKLQEDKKALKAAKHKKHQLKKSDVPVPTAPAVANPVSQ